MRVFFCVPFVSVSHMKLLFRFVFLLLFFFLLRDFAVLIGIYSTKPITNSCASFCLKCKSIRKDDVDRADIIHFRL